MDTNILLESGTNELEILEFKVADNYYGINVAKIIEILNYQHVTPVPNSHPFVEGIFMPRDTIISVINLRKCLGYPDNPNNEGLLFITNFNNLNTAFHVDQVLGELVDQSGRLGVFVVRRHGGADFERGNE